MNNLNKKLYRAIQKGLLEGLNLDNIDIEDLNDIKINKVSSSTRSLKKAELIENNYELQTLIDSSNYSLIEVQDLIAKGAIYKASNDTLKSVVTKYIKKSCYTCDLNWIDTSEITDMSKLFEYNNFNGNISKWDVSHVTDMNRLFFDCQFNGDISEWNVSNVTNMEAMFAYSQFNGDISNWNVYNVTNMRYMFWASKFNEFNDYAYIWKIHPSCDTFRMVDE